jgi:polyphosphate kinase
MAKKSDEAQNSKMKRKKYEAELHKLKVGLCNLTRMKQMGLRVIVMFEGCDAA